MYSMSKENRRDMGMKGRQHILDNYNFVNFQRAWINLMDDVTENGSWETRQGYNGIRFKEIA